MIHSSDDRPSMQPPHRLQVMKIIGNDRKSSWLCRFHVRKLKMFYYSLSGTYFYGHKIRRSLQLHQSIAAAARTVKPTVLGSADDNELSSVLLAYSRSASRPLGLGSPSLANQRMLPPLTSLWIQPAKNKSTKPVNLLSICPPNHFVRKHTH